MTKPQERFEVGNQPCKHFLRGDADIAALGEGNRRNLHQCPKCSGNRAWCDHCNTDHHDGGWEACKPGAFEEDWADEQAETIVDLICKVNWKNGGVLVLDRLDRIEYVAAQLRYTRKAGEEIGVTRLATAFGTT